MTTLDPQADDDVQGPNCAIAVSIRFGGTWAVNRRVQSACASTSSLVSVTTAATARPAAIGRDVPHVDRVMCLLLLPDQTNAGIDVVNDKGVKLIRHE